MKITCPDCGQKMEDDPGYYYHGKRHDSEKAWARYREAEVAGADYDTLRRLRRLAEDAGYTGD